MDGLLCRGADLDDLCPYLRNASMLDLVVRFLRNLRTRMFVRVRPSTSVDGTLLVQATTISGVSTASCAFTGSRGLNFVSRFSWLRPRMGMRPYTAHVRFFILSA